MPKKRQKVPKISKNQLLFHLEVLFFRWFRHITDASNAYRARDSTRRGRYPADPHNGLEKGERGKTDDHLGLPDGDKKGQPAGRSQSFHEQSTSNREPHPERQPSSPPEERTESGSQKAGKSFISYHGINVFYFTL